jgi:hypothetical protein
MKVYNLACPLQHHFEGWFASEEDCLAQQEKDLLACPFCDSKEIIRMPSAPHISKTAGHHTSSESTALTMSNNAHAHDSNEARGEVMTLANPDRAQLEAQVQAAFLKGMQELLVQSEDVGRSFAEEARKIHYKESPERSIRGQTTLDEAESLRDEGIEVMALPMLPMLKNTLQ